MNYVSTYYKILRALALSFVYLSILLPSLQNAIDAAADGDTLYVDDTFISEQISIDKPLTIVGNSTIIEVLGSYGVLISSDDVDLSGFVIMMSDQALYGIFGISGLSDVSIHDNTITSYNSEARGDYGIYFQKNMVDNSTVAEDISISGNTIYNLSSSGIYIGSTGTGIEIADNNI